MLYEGLVVFIVSRTWTRPQYIWDIYEGMGAYWALKDSTSDEQVDSASLHFSLSSADVTIRLLLDIRIVCPAVVANCTIRRKPRTMT